MTPTEMKEIALASKTNESPVDLRKNEGYRLLKLREKITKHGASIKGKVTPEYRAWQNMKNRCYVKTNQDYENYGGRGIKVSDEWLNDFSAFLRDIGKRPSFDLTLDRINHNGNYEPGNVRWADSLTQVRNRRGWKNKHHNGNIKGISWRKDIQKWSARIGIGYKNINLGTFLDKQEAIMARITAETKYWNYAS